MQTIPHITIYSDGGGEPNPGKGGFAVIMDYMGRRKEFYQGYELTTNNRMELTAVIRALEALKRSTVVDLYTDSEYVRRGITEWLVSWKARGWRTADKKPVKNQDLWVELDQLAQQHEIAWH